jgi:hypothetical protein
MARSFSSARNWSEVLVYSALFPVLFLLFRIPYNLLLGAIGLPHVRPNALAEPIELFVSGFLAFLVALGVSGLTRDPQIWAWRTVGLIAGLLAVVMVGVALGSRAPDFGNIVRNVGRFSIEIVLLASAASFLAQYIARWWATSRSALAKRLVVSPRSDLLLAVVREWSGSGDYSDGNFTYRLPSNS